jgi:hypothetical protein
MIRIEDLRICQTVMYNGVKCRVYSIMGARPDKNERYDDKPTVELFDGAGLITALEEEIFPCEVAEEATERKAVYSNEDRNDYYQKCLDEYERENRVLMALVKREHPRLDEVSSEDYKWRYMNGVDKVFYDMIQWFINNRQVIGCTGRGFANYAYDKVMRPYIIVNTYSDAEMCCADCAFSEVNEQGVTLCNPLVYLFDGEHRFTVSPSAHCRAFEHKCKE